MLIHPGSQERLIAESPASAGSTSREGSIQSDSLLVTLWVDSVTSGSLTVTVYTLTDTGKEVGVISFPAVAAPTTQLLLRKSAISLQRFRVVASYTGGCSYEVYVRAIEGSGEASARILGSTNWRVSQETVGTTPVVLIAAALTDRQGVLVKNWSATANLFIGEDISKADSAVGYPLAPKDALALDIAAGAAVYGVSDVPGADVRIVEAGG
jgi:hypothetical protein